jgi:hypothetical protein
MRSLFGLCTANGVPTASPPPHQPLTAKRIASRIDGSAASHGRCVLKLEESTQ